MNNLHRDINTRLAFIGDEVASLFHLFQKTSNEDLQSLETYENTFISEYAAIEFLGLVGYDYKEFSELLKYYKIEVFTVSPGNIRVYRKSQIMSAKRHEFRLDLLSTELKEIRAKNSNQSDITRMISLLLDETGITHSGESSKF
jgi:hypothetical protein